MPPAVKRVEDSFVDADGVTTFFYCWSPRAPKGVIHLVHGLGEHARRYEPLANNLAQAGFEVWAQDYRGHGQTGIGQWGTSSKLGRLGPGGLPATLRALLDFHRQIHQARPQLPVVFLGHSMGSLFGQILLNRGLSQEVDGVVLTGTSYRMPGYLNSGDLNAKHRHLGQTGAEWLSRDTTVHEQWVSDPLTFPANTLKLFRLIDSARLLGTPRALERNIPLLLMVGADDSLGGPRGAEKLASAYRARGVTDVVCRVYSGARHEVFNETNRDEVISDLVDWLDGVCSAPRK